MTDTKPGAENARPLVTASGIRPQRGQKERGNKMKHYNLDEIKTELKNDIARYTAFAEAWEAVTFPVKKDGKPFAVMSKNISGAKYSPVAYAMQAGEYEITVFSHCRECGYIHESINAYEIARYMKDEAKKAKTQNLMPKQSFLEQVYAYDLDDIKKAVADRAAYCREYVADLQKQLEEVDGIFYRFRDAFADALKQLEADTTHHTHKDTFYAVKDTVLSRYPYC